MPPRNQPDVIYLRQIPTLVVHFFTLVQLLCLCFLCAIRLTYASIVFPMAVSVIYAFFITLVLKNIVGFSDSKLQVAEISPINKKARPLKN